MKMFIVKRMVTGKGYKPTGGAKQLPQRTPRVAASAVIGRVLTARACVAPSLGLAPRVLTGHTYAAVPLFIACDGWMDGWMDR